ncbi:MAG: hypothetical protein IJO85_08210 [Lachnospiraceae bacterium]|nr:hypothetical protein [Lachnospiraceae bacterium]
MASFSIKTNNIQHIVGDLSDSASKIRDYSDVISQVRGSLSSTLAHSGNVQKRLEYLVSNCEDYRAGLFRMSGKLDEIILLYLAIEKGIVDNAVVQSPTYSSVPSDEERLSGGHYVSEPDTWDYILRSLEQILLGSFTEESTLLGIIGSVLVGCVPPFNVIADIRDILGDFYQFRDGVDTDEIISLVVDVVAIIPLCDLLKYADECFGLTKYLDDAGDILGEALDGIIDYAKGTWKSADDVMSKVDELVDKGGEFMDDVINGIMDMYNKTPDAIKKGINRTSDMLSKEIGESTIGGIIKDVVDDYIGVQDRLIDAAGDALDNIGIGGNIVDATEDVLQDIGQGMEYVGDYVSSKWDEMWDMLKGQPQVVYI